MAFEKFRQLINDKKAARRARIHAKQYEESYDPGNPYNLGPGEESFTPDPGFNQRLMEKGPEPNINETFLEQMYNRPFREQGPYEHGFQSESLEDFPSDAGILDKVLRYGPPTPFSGAYRMGSDAYDIGKSLYDNYDGPSMELPRMSPGFPFVPEMEEKIY